MRDFNFVDSSKKLDKEQIRESLTYWKDVWRRLKGNLMAMFGLIMVFLIVIFAVFGPLITGYDYREQATDYTNLPPKLDVYQVTEDKYVFLNKAYWLLLVDEDGTLIERLDRIRVDAVNKIYYYEYEGEEIAVDFSYRVLPNYEGDIDYTVTYQGVEVTHPSETLHNKLYVLGTDHLGRDILTRLMYGARISLTVAIVAALVNLLIGVAYGSISGFLGGRADDIMMRIVDIINSIPLVIYVILLMVLLNKSNIWTIILALGTVYWVGMARLVRAQIISLKDQEFVLAARVIGVKQSKIISRHLIPNALGPIIVSLTMSIPSAIFTEAFLSFIGIGMSPPAASWGTMTNEAISQLDVYLYQMLCPAISIAITVLSFNFLGAGLRSALDPRLRKG